MCTYVCLCICCVSYISILQLLCNSIADIKWPLSKYKLWIIFSWLNISNSNVIVVLGKRPSKIGFLFVSVIAIYSYLQYQFVKFSERMLLSHGGEQQNEVIILPHIGWWPVSATHRHSKFLTVLSLTRHGTDLPLCALAWTVPNRLEPAWQMSLQHACELKSGQQNLQDCRRLTP